MKKIMLVITLFTVVFLAACELTPETYTVTYEVNGGTLSGEYATTVEDGKSITEPTVSKEGSSLLGWYSDSTYNVAYDFSQPVNGNLKLFAKWELDSYVVTYYTPEQYQVYDLDYNSDLTIPSEPMKTGYTFSGWYLDEECTVDLEDDAIVTGDMDIYALFTINTYNLKIMANGVTISSTYYTYGELVAIPETYTEEGLIFNGVYTSTSYTSEVNNGEYTMPAEDVTLFIELMEDVNTLIIYYVPARPADEVLEITAPLVDLLETAMELAGMPFNDVEIRVGSTYEVVGEALISGTASVGFLPAMTYVQYKDAIDSPIEPLVAAARTGLTKDYADAADWNDGIPTEFDPEYMVPYYRGLIIAGPSTDGMTLAGKVNNGQTLVWDDVKDLTWCVRSMTSSSGYVYPNMWLSETFGHTFDDMSNVVETFGYGHSIEMLANESCDIATVYADARRDYASYWVNDYEREFTIWQETNVVGVTAPIMNDIIAYNSDNITGEMVDFLMGFFMTLNETPTGQNIMSIYSHQAYIEITDEDYDYQRIALEFYGY